MSTNKDIKEEIFFGGGLDTDSDEKYVKNGDYIDAKNVVKVEDGENGILVNVKGNESVLTFPDQGYDYVCGWEYYDRRESVILFIFSQDRDSEIVEFNPETGVSTTLIDSTPSDILGFKRPSTNDYFIDTDIAGEWLAWTDNTNPPRMINIEDVRNGTVTVNEAYLDLHKIRPTAKSVSKHIPPLVSLGYDSAKKYNNLTTGYQFKYRFGYSDFRYSTWSPASDLAINQTLVRSGGQQTLIGSSNYVDVQFNSGDANVSFVDIAIREGNTGNWFRIVKIDKSDPEKVYSTGGALQTSALTDNTDYDYRFYNNEGRIAVSNTEASKLYDLVPDTSEAISFIGDNRLSLGGNVEGKDLIDLNVSLSVTNTNINLFEAWELDSIIYDPTYIEIVFLLDDVALFSNGVNTGDYVYFDWTLTGVGTDLNDLDFSTDQYVVFDASRSGIDSIGAYLAANTVPMIASGDTGTSRVLYSSSLNKLSFRFEPNNRTIDTTGSGSVSVVTQPSSLDTNNNLVYATTYTLNASTTGYVNDLGFSDGTTHKLALIYEDKYGKQWPPLTSTETEVEVEPIASGTTAKHRSIQYTISNSAPAGAVAYRWAYAYKPKSFVQTIITDVSQFEDGSGNLNTRLIALDVSASGQFVLLNYTPEVGDKIRIIRQGGAYAALGSYVDDAPEFIVEDVKDTINDGSNNIAGQWLIVKESLVPGYTVANIGDPSNFMNALVEISKQTTEDQDYAFYEIGSGGYCVGGTTNHDDWFTGTNTGYLNQGDVWYRTISMYRRESVTKTDVSLVGVYASSPFPYDNASRKDVGIADINVEFPESENKYFNTIRWSKNFIEDTKLNGLSSFDNLNRIKVSENHGKIKGLEELGDSLVVICEEKVLSSYVGATEYTDTQGNVNVVKSTTPLNYLRADDERYGTFLKESICNTGKHIYFYDLLNGVAVRKSKNGLFPISGRISTPQGSYDYKMRTYFKELSDNLVDSLYDGIASSSVSGIIANYADVKCFVGFDPYYENVYFKFLDRITAANNVTIIFHEPSNRWVSEYATDDGNYKSTFFPFTKKDIFSSIELTGTLYKLNSDTADRCNLYGQAQSSYIEFVSHGMPNMVKIFNAIAIHSDDNWTVDYIQISPNDSYSNGMYTKILDSEWIKEEGVYKYEIPRNMYTRSSTLSNWDRLEGESLRGYVVRVKMTNTTTTETELFKVDLIQELSR